MKRIFFLFALALGLSVTAFAQGTPKMEFEATEIDYGTIAQGSDPYRIFTFTNTGDAPLLITNAKGSCGCTVPEVPQGAIAPGTSAEIKVRYDTNRPGPFTKRVTLTTNASAEPIILTIKGKVEPKPAEPDGVPAKQNGIFNGGGN